ncbi:helix-turn-helix domain-containing protein [Natrinema amylolyticum]|uniref:helix-turn-helix domain-containing protein n=1 Tax=Natrinema amylolyticum TaxID=2878679 RepID=UPI001CFAE896|nr:helix-turn-helix domain-containing protein [Natrinema amylolyticum]
MREAIVTLSDAELEAMGFSGLVSLLREAGIRDVEMLEDRGYTCVPQVEVEARLDADALADLDCVDDWELVAETEDAYRYLLELTATELPEETVDDHAALLGACETTVTDHGALVSLVGSQDAIREMLRHYEAAGVTPDLCKLGEYDGEASALDALTDRQREVIETAYEMGFYEIPRQASTDDVAGTLDVDAATVSEHLQRAERNLLMRQLPM